MSKMELIAKVELLNEYEAMIEEVTGNTDKALALFRAGKQNWPDDTDFAAGIARLTKRGKKKC